MIKSISFSSFFKSNLTKKIFHFISLKKVNLLIKQLLSESAALWLPLRLHMLDLSIANCTYLDLAKKVQPNQRMYGKRPQCFLDGLRFRLIHPDSEGCNFIMLFDRSSPIFLACKKWNKSTMSSRRLATFKDGR